MSPYNDAVNFVTNISNLRSFGLQEEISEYEIPN